MARAGPRSLAKRFGGARHRKKSVTTGAGAARSEERHGLDFNLRARGERRDLDRRAGRRRVARMTGVDLVHRLEVAEVGQEDRGLDEPIEPAACLFEDRTEVAKRLLGLLLDPGGELALFRA